MTAFLLIVILSVVTSPNTFAQETDSSKPSPSSPTHTPEGFVHIQPAAIMDVAGFGKPMVAVTQMVPAGWKTQGGIVWDQNLSGCGRNTPHFNWTATSPDDLGMISVLPEETWSGYPQIAGMPLSSCPNVWETDVKQLILNYVQRYRPEGRLFDYQDRSGELTAMQQQLKLTQTNIPGTETRRWAGAGQALIGYAVNGREVREVIGTIIVFTHFKMQGVYQGDVWETLTIASLPGFAMRMPAGALDFRLAEMFRKSNKPNPEWQSKIAGHHVKMARINNKGVADRAAIITQTNNEISDIQMQMYQDQQASDAYIQRENSEALRGLETYKDPDSDGTIQLDSTFENAWKLNDGTFALTNDPSFNVYAETGQDGQKMEVAE